MFRTSHVSLTQRVYLDVDAYIKVGDTSLFMTVDTDVQKCRQFKLLKNIPQCKYAIYTTFVAYLSKYVYVTKHINKRCVHT